MLKYFEKLFRKNELDIELFKCWQKRIFIRPKRKGFETLQQISELNLKTVRFT